MADLERIKKDIADLSKRRKSVRFGEIQRIVSQLGKVGYSVGERPVTHGTLFRVHNKRFGVSDHHPGSSYIRPTYVDVFLEAMLELGLYEE